MSFGLKIKVVYSDYLITFEKRLQMSSIKFVCGEIDGPVPGQTQFKSEAFKDILIDTIEVNNTSENQLTPSQGFDHYYKQGMIDRAPNVWVAGDKLVVFTSKCKKC